MNESQLSTFFLFVKRQETSREKNNFLHRAPR